MSVHAYETKNGIRYKARYYDHFGLLRSKSGFTTKSEAKRFEEMKRLEKRVGVPGAMLANQETVREAYDDWMRVHVKARLSPVTQECYETLAKLHLLPYLGDVPMVQLCEKPMMLDEWYATLERNGVGPASIKKTIMVLSGVMTAAARWRKVSFNPVLAMPKPRVERKLTISPWSRDEVVRIVDACPDRSSRAIAALCGLAGLRPGEALALGSADLRASQGRILVRASLGTDNKIGPVKTLSQRSVEPDPAIWQYLEDTHGESVVGWTYYQFKSFGKYKFPKLLETLTLPAGRVYDLRHSRASWLIREGMDVVRVAKQMGHSTEMCLRTYAHVFDEARILR